MNEPVSIEGPGWIIDMKPEASPDDVLALSTLWHRLGLTIRPTSEQLDLDRLAQALLRAGLTEWSGDTIPPADELAALIAREYAKEKA